MKNVIRLALLLGPVLFFAQTSQPTKKVLMVLSSYGKDQGETRPGFEFDEFAQAYLVFKNNGLQIELASPKGGAVIADKYDPKKAYNQAVLQLNEAQRQLENTLPTAQLNAATYDAIYIVGGKGAMFDLPFDPALQDLILKLYEREKTVLASVCHGPAVFTQVKSGDKYIIDGVGLTGFTNMEEKLFGKKWVKEFPFALEDKLKDRGAHFSEADFMLGHVVVSGKFVTGQNPFSTAKSAEAVVTALGLDVVERKAYTDENSMYLIKDVLMGKTSIPEAEKILAEQTEAFDIQLLSVYGFYKLRHAEGQRENLKQGITIVELGAPYFFNEKLQLQLAKSYSEIGDKSKAKEILKKLIAKELVVEEANKLLQEL